MRLNMNDRHSVVCRALEARFDGPKAELKKQEDALARRLYAMTYPEKVMKWAAQAPKGWLYQDSCLRFNLAGHTVVLHTFEPVPVPHARHCTELKAFADESFREEHEKLDQAKQTLKQERRDAERQLAAMVDRFGTLARLRDAWPEGAPFYAHLQPKERVDVPAVQIADINKSLGIGEPA